MARVLSAIAATWRSSPALRFLGRTAAVAVVSYIVGALKAGETLDLEALGIATAVATGTALLGLLTPLEPFVGPGYAKPSRVQVPSPPAEPELDYHDADELERDLGLSEEGSTR